MTAAIFVVVGGIFIFSAKSEVDSVSPVAGGQTTTGIIAAVNTGQNYGRGGCTPWWQPTIQFTSAADKVVTFTGPQNNNMDQIGDTVRASYNPPTRPLHTTYRPMSARLQ